MQLQLQIPISGQKRHEAFISIRFAAGRDLFLNSRDDAATGCTQRGKVLLCYGLVDCVSKRGFGIGCFLCSGCKRSVELCKVIRNLLANIRNGLRSKVKLLASLHVLGLQLP